MLKLILFVIVYQTVDNNAETYLSSPDLEQLIKSGKFVDKTEIVKVFFESPEALMVTAPRRFGKSTNLGIIKRFCEITVNQTGQQLENKMSKNYRLFTQHNLSIYRDHEEFFNKNFGRYPVIHLSFKDLDCESYDGFISSFRSLVLEVYTSHEYLIHSNTIDKHDLDYFNDLRHFKKICDVTVNNLIRAVEQLSRFLYTHFDGMKCIILLDEFDAPIQRAINQGTSDITNILKLLVKFISITLKDNEFIERSLITGCTSLSRIFTYYANNIIHIPFLSDPRWSRFYGLTESEVRDLLAIDNISNSLASVKTWYDGYISMETNDTIYNVFGIMKYLYTRKLANHWSECAGIKGIERMFAKRTINHIVEKLLEDFKGERTGIEITLRPTTSISDIIILREYAKSTSDIDKIDNDLYFQYLTDHGYFNIVKQDKQNVFIRIPNKEIESEINRILSDRLFYRFKFQNKYDIFERIGPHIQALNESKNPYLELIKVIENAYSINNTKPYNEYALQRDIQWSCEFPKIPKLFSEVRTEVPVQGGGRVDLVLVNDDKAIAIELKLGWKSAHEALQQIIDRNYYTVLTQYVSHMKIYMGLYLSKSGRPKCSISYLVNCTDINKAVNVNRILEPSTRSPRTRRTGYTHKPRCTTDAMITKS